MTELPAMPSGLFLFAIANEIELQLGIARQTYPDRGAELDRLAKSAQLIRDHANKISDQTIQDIPGETLIEIRDLLVSTMELAKAFGRDGQRLQ